MNIGAKKNDKQVIIIAGPTACGKSRLALNIARRVPSTIINADSMQVYHGLPILTAQPTQADMAAVPHALYSVVSPSVRLGVARWQTLACDAIEQSLAQGRCPLVVGGTGFYLRVVMEGLSTVPDIPLSVREEATALRHKLGNQAFFEHLTTLDPLITKQLYVNDTYRVLRAYEVIRATGKSLAVWHQETTKAPPWSFYKILLLPDRKYLYPQIDQRFEKMIEEGALEEVRWLKDQQLDRELPAMKILGVPELLSYLSQEITLKEACDKAKQMSRNFAKRQYTWFNSQYSSDWTVTSLYTDDLDESLGGKLVFDEAF